MSDENLFHAGDKPVGSRAHQSRPLWMWFLGGFLLVFIAMALLIRMHALAPHGRGVVECRLWEYYIIEIRSAIQGGPIGPGTRSMSGVLTTTFQHTSISIVGGGVALGIGWVIARRANRTNAK